MRRLVTRWIGLIVFVAILGTVFVLMGQWQLRRLDQRQHRNASTIVNEKAPVQPFQEVFDHPITDADQWQRVQARGTFDADQQFVIRYRNNNDRSGYEVVTPLRTDFGTILVDRGFIEVPKGTKTPTAGPAPPSGTVTVVGHVRRNEQGRKGAIQPSDHSARLINSEALSAAAGYPLLNGYIGALTMDPPQQGDFTAIELPEISDGPHFWYAVQWFMFTGIGVLGIVVFIRGDLRTRREEQAKESEADVGAANSAPAEDHRAPSTN